MNQGSSYQLLKLNYRLFMKLFLYLFWFLPAISLARPLPVDTGENTKNSRIEGVEWRESGNQLLNAGQMEAALDHYTGCAARFLQDGQPDASFTAELRACEILAFQKDQAAVIQRLTPWRNKHPGLFERTPQAMLLLGTAYWWAGDFASYADLFRQGEAICQSMGSAGDSLLGEFCIWEARFQVAQQAIPQAMQTLDSIQSQTGQSGGPRPTQVPLLHVALAEGYTGLNQLDKARFYYLKALSELGTSLSEAMLRLDILQSYMEFLANTGDFYRMQKAGSQALELARTRFPEAKFVQGELSIMMSYCMGNMGAFELQKTYIDQSHAIFAALPETDPLTLASVYNGYAVYFSFVGDYERTHHYISKAISLLEALPPNPGLLLHLARLYENMGAALAGYGQFEQALASSFHSLELRQSLLAPSRPEISDSYYAIGTVYSRMGRHREAGEAFQKGWEVVNFPESSAFNRAVYLLQWGEACYRKRAYTEAVEKSQAATELLEKQFGQRHPETAKSRILLMKSLLHDAHISDALQEGALALDAILLPDLDLDYSTVKPHQVSSKIIFIQAILEYAEVLKADAIARQSPEPLRKGLKLLHTAIDFRESLLGDFSLVGSPDLENEVGLKLVELALEMVKELEQQGEFYPEEALFFTESFKAHRLLEVAKARNIDQFFGVPSELIHAQEVLAETYFAAVQDLDLARKRGDKSLPQLQDQVFLLARQRDELKDYIKHNYPKYYQIRIAPQLTPLSDLQRMMADEAMQGALLIEYFWGNRAVYVMGLDAEKVTFFQIPRSADLDASLAGYRMALENINASDSALALGNRFYQELLEPVLKAHGEATRLGLVTDGPLLDIPFSSLPTTLPDAASGPPNWSWLLRDYSVFYDFSGTMMHHNFIAGKQRQGPSEIQFSMFAPDFSGDEAALPALPANTALAEKLEARYPSQLLQGELATESRFKAGIPQADILLFNTHGKSNLEQAMSSGIQLMPDDQEDGFLHLRELFAMRVNARLAVLSACQTGLGQHQPGEYSLSMAWGFAYAGCPSLVTSLWDQSDNSSAEILEAYFEGLALGQPKDVAMQNAQLKYLEETSSYGSRPFFWACMQQVGDVVPIKLTPRRAWRHQAPWLAGSLVLLAAAALWMRRQRKTKKGQS